MSDHLNKQNHGLGRVPGYPRLLGGQLSLDFVNSVEGRIGPRPQDCLTDAVSLIEWGYHVSLLTETERNELLRNARRQPEVTACTFSEAVQFREALYRIFLAFLNNESPRKEDLELLREEYVAGLSQAQLNADAMGVSWHWPLTPDLRGMIWAIARSAMDLLKSVELVRVKQCPGCEDCGWLFLDTSKGGKRQWCSMEGCGSRVKMRRHYQRQRQKPLSALPSVLPNERKKP